MHLVDDLIILWGDDKDVKFKLCKKIISDYCVIDTETTGLSSYYDEIIEVGILKYVMVR